MSWVSLMFGPAHRGAHLRLPRIPAESKRKVGRISEQKGVNFFIDTVKYFKNFVVIIPNQIKPPIDISDTVTTNMISVMIPPFEATDYICVDSADSVPTTTTKNASSCLEIFAVTI